MDKKLAFRAEDVRLKDVLFNNDSKYQIPRYQRSYSWEEDQLADFWSDLVENNDERFIGSFILNVESVEDSGFTDVIDGQQRLLTITILCAVLRDIVGLISPKRAELYQRKDLAIEDNDGIESFRILPPELIQEFFEEHIQKPTGDALNSKPNTTEERRIHAAYKYFHTKAQEVLDTLPDDRTREEWINELRHRIYNLIAIRIQIEDEEEAYEIFETTNARGVELSVADLVKNLVFKKLPAKKRTDKAKQIWQEITSNVEATESDLKRFIRYHWISKEGSVQEKKLYRSISNVKDWSKFLTDLQSDSNLFRLLLDGSEDEFYCYKHGYKIFNAVFAIRLMGVSQCYVLMMSILRNYDKLGTDPVRIFRLLENFTFQYSVVSKLPGNRVEKLYSKFAVNLEKLSRMSSSKNRQKRIASLFSELEKELKMDRPPKELFLERFKTLRYKNSAKGRKLIKYVLARIDQYYRDTGEEKIDFNVVNVEHLLPRNPQSAWGLNKNEIKSYVNLLGNLTLVSKRINSKAQNKTIEAKLIALRESSLPITRVLIPELEAIVESGRAWGEEDIFRRQQQLAKLGLDKIWKL